MAQKLPESVGAAWQHFEEAEQAIAARYVSLDPVRDVDEAQRMSDAAHNLSVLRREAR